jgi:hypothetical protein
MSSDQRRFFFKTEDDEVRGPHEYEQMVEFLHDAVITTKTPVKPDEDESEWLPTIETEALGWYFAKGNSEQQHKLFYRNEEGQRCGPIEMDAIFGLLKDGTITTDTLLKTDATGSEWVAAGKSEYCDVAAQGDHRSARGLPVFGSGRRESLYAADPLREFDQENSAFGTGASRRFSRASGQ